MKSASQWRELFRSGPMGTGRSWCFSRSGLGVCLAGITLISTALPSHAADAPAASRVLEEVLVTARKRTESMQEIPIAVTAISGRDLREKGIANTAELTKSVPSLEIRKGQANQIYIRGIGERTGFARVDPAVGVYLDDLFLPRSDGQLLDTIDIQSIQVLRGPQGTLFGKNTTGGAMVVSLVKPHEEEEGYVDAMLGNYGQQRLKAGFNQPISDRFFVRGALNITKDDGYFKNIGQGRNNPTNDRQALLFQTRWEPGDDFTLDSQIFYGKIRENFPGINCNVPSDDALFIRGLWVAHPGDTDPSNPQALRANCERNSRQQLGDLTADQGPNAQLDKDLDTVLLGATAEWQFTEHHALKLVAGARGEKEGPIQASDSDGGPEQWGNNINTEDSDRTSFSLELQLNGDFFDQRLRYTTGVFVMRETNTENFTTSSVLKGIDIQTLGDLVAGEIPSQPVAPSVPMVGILGGPSVSSDFDLENTTAAIFAQVSYDLTQNLELTLGARWTSEERISELTVTQADFEAIASRIQGTGLFGPSVGGFHQYLGPLGWNDDPVSIAANLFPDADGDGLLDYPMDPASTQTETAKDTFRQATPMMSLSYSLPDRLLESTFIDSSLVYATWSKGFKSGFFEPRGIDGLQRVEPEVVVNREVGIKLDAFEHSLRFNAAFYSMTFDDQQLISVGSDSGQNLVVVFGNAGESEITGAEFEMNWLPLPALAINLSFSVNDYEFVEFTELDLLAAIVGQEVLVDRTDETFPVSPEQSGAMGIQYTWQTSVGEFTPRLDVSYKSDVFYGFDPGSYAAFERDVSLAGQEAYSLVDFRFSWQNPEQDMSVTAWMKNVADERYLIGVVAVADSSGNFTQSYGEPRMYGFSVRKSF